MTRRFSEAAREVVEVLKNLVLLYQRGFSLNQNPSDLPGKRRTREKVVEPLSVLEPQLEAERQLLKTLFYTEAKTRRGAAEEGKEETEKTRRLITSSAA